MYSPFFECVRRSQFLKGEYFLQRKQITRNWKLRLLLLCFASLLVFPHGPDGKKFACNAGDLDSIPGLRQTPGGGNGYSVQNS